MKSYKYIIKGKVQGVYYRKNVCENALKENFKGYVKNLPNGDVEACVTCLLEEHTRFLEILKQGSPNSIVKDIEGFEILEIFRETFFIKYD